MVGRPVELTRTIPPVDHGDEKLRVSNLSVRGDRGLVAVDGVSITVRAGEIVGVAGVSGNGQRELAEAIVGLRPIESGDLLVHGQTIPAPTPNGMRASGLAYVPEERMRDGAISEFSVSENLMLLDYDQAPYARFGLLDRKSISDRCADLVDRYSVKTPTLTTPAGNLSGGNIQKVVIAREFSSNADVLIVAQPTRGVDIGAAEYIHERLLEQRSALAAILLISEDLDEVLELSDRVVVLFEGRIMGDVARAEATKETIGLLMSGVSSDSSVAELPGEDDRGPDSR